MDFNECIFRLVLLKKDQTITRIMQLSLEMLDTHERLFKCVNLCDGMPENTTLYLSRDTNTF